MAELTQEEQALDELLADEAIPGSIDNTIKVFPDEQRLDKTKTTGRGHRALLKSVVTRFRAWVLALVTPLQSDIAAINEILNMPPPPPQDVKWKAEPTVIIEDGKVKVGAGLALWKGPELSFLPQEFPIDALTDNTKIRLDMVYATEQGQYGVLKGNEGNEATRKALPEGALWVRDVIVKGSGATVGQPGDYVTVQELADALAGKADLINGKVPAEQLPEIGGAGEATLEAASTILNFSNPFGHIRNEALSGAQTFTKQGTSVGSTVVQAYTATGAGALAFDFPHTILNSVFASGGVLAAGEYKLFFSNWADVVAISIATVGSGVEPEPEPENTPPTISLLGANPMTLTVGHTYTEPGATAADAEQGDLTSSIVITGNVNTAVAGTYTVTYKVTDAGGLSDTKTRTVTVNDPGNITPAAPTGGSVDDANDTFTFTLAAN